MNEPVLGYFGGDTPPLGGPVQMHPKHIFVFFTREQPWKRKSMNYNHTAIPGEKRTGCRDRYRDDTSGTRTPTPASGSRALHSTRLHQQKY